MSPSQPKVRLVYLAWVRERIGRSTEDIALPTEVATAADLVRWLAARGPEYAHAFERPEVIRVAVDQRHVDPATPLAGAREIAFFPPVTGG
jgi:molybdopterin synthase sulfur carrier subunit